MQCAYRWRSQGGNGRKRPFNLPPLSKQKDQLVSCQRDDQEELCSSCFQDATVDDAVLRKKEQKDVELDKKILALRKKNEALIRRYQVRLLDSYLPQLCFGVLTTHSMKKIVSSG